jgi:hypothetical protein
MNREAQERKYSDDEFLIKAIELIKEGYTEEDVQSDFNLSDNDMVLIDFVINEF